MKPRFLLVALLALALFVVGMAAALAADGTKQVGLVIAFPDGTQHAEIVTVPITATTYDALAKAQIELIGASAQFGPAVCSINKIGCPAANCFCDAKHFWAFYHLDPSGQWVVSQEGVGAAVPADHAVEGLAWSDMDANFNPLVKPPVLTFAQIQAPAPAATPSAGLATSAAAPRAASSAATSTVATTSASATPGAASQPATANPAATPSPSALPTTGGRSGAWLLVVAGALLLAGVVLGPGRRSSRGSA